MNQHPASFILSIQERAALEALCRRRKIDALVWKRARAILLLDAGYDAKTICEVLDIGPTVLTQWKGCFADQGLPFFGLKDYSQRQGHLSVAQEGELKAHFTDNPARNVDEVCAYILAQYKQSYCPSGAAKLMGRLGFVYKKPRSLPAQADEAKQQAFIAHYEALMTGLGDDEMVRMQSTQHTKAAPPMAGFPRNKRPPSKPVQGATVHTVRIARKLPEWQ